MEQDEGSLLISPLMRCEMKALFQGWYILGAFSGETLTNPDVLTVPFTPPPQPHRFLHTHLQNMHSSWYVCSRGPGGVQACGPL